MSIATDRPFHGLKVLDLSMGIAGPYCASILRQQGAEVIKVEPPHGDWGRVMGPKREGFTAIAIAFNAGKRAICVDTRKAGGREVLERIAASADVVIQNFRPGVADKMGLGYEAVRKLNPNVLYVSISGFGATGPYCEMPAVDLVLQAMNGMMVANKDAQGTPQRLNLYLIDVSTGLYAAQVLSSHLYSQAKNGGGSRHIEVSLMEASAALQAYLLLGSHLHPTPAPAALTAPSGLFETADGHIILGTMNDNMFKEICEGLGLTEWLADPRYATMASRVDHMQELNATVAGIIKAKPTSYWLEQFRRRDAVHAPVNDYRGFVADPQAAHADCFLPLNQPGIGTLPFPRHPANPVEEIPAAPLLGEHTAPVLAEYGYSEEEIAALTRDKVIYAPPTEQGQVAGAAA